MFPRLARHVLRNAAPKSQITSTRTLYPYTRSLVVRLKGKDEMNTVEKLFWVFAATATILSVPGYVLINLDSYKGTK